MKDRGVDILSIGDEILIGQIVNTNASWMGELLNRYNFKVRRIISVGDTEAEIASAFAESIEKVAVVLVTGGLGPTKDDRTKKVICDFFNTHLVLDSQVLEHVTQFFAQRGKPLTELNRLQAMVPEAAIVLPNHLGTAPSLHLIKNQTHFIFMPGVPFEMKEIMKLQVIPFLQQNIKTTPKAQRTVLTSGLGESFLADKISSWEESLPQNASLAYLPSPGKVRLRLTFEHPQQEMADRQLEEWLSILQQIIGDLIYGFEDDALEQMVAVALRNQHKILALAESCTGGAIAQRITSVPGSSAFFRGGIVAYSNSIKEQALGVDPKLIQTYGAVSEEVAKAMAQGALKLMQADVAVAVTGIAGPEGGTDQKPVGTVFIAFADQQQCFAQQFQFGNERLRNIEWTVQSALSMLRKQLLTING